MRKKEYVVRVVQVEGDEAINSAFLECLRYAGYIDTHEVDPEGLTTCCFDIRAPHGLNSKLWSEMNAERMRSFGFNAVSAPSTR